MATEAHLDLKAGDQIIATKIAFFSHKPEMQSQHVGDLLMVNNPRMRNYVGGTLLNNRPGGKPRVGLGGGFEAGTFRRATPADPGYLGTREQWDAIKNAEITQLKLTLSRKRADFMLLAAIAGILALALLLA